MIGYENRLLRDEDFNDDTKDAGEIGAGHTVTALYEIVPVGQELPGSKADPLKYRAQPELKAEAHGSEWLTLKLRYKQPDGEQSRLIEFPVEHDPAARTDDSDNYRWSAAVAGFGMLLRDSKYKGTTNVGLILDLARPAVGADRHGYRKEFLELVEKVRKLKPDE